MLGIFVFCTAMIVCGFVAGYFAGCLHQKCQLRRYPVRHDGHLLRAYCATARIQLDRWYGGPVSPAVSSALPDAGKVREHSQGGL